MKTPRAESKSRTGKAADSRVTADRHYYYVRAQQQNRLMAWSGPMFITH